MRDVTSMEVSMASANYPSYAIDESGVERKFIAGDKLPYGPL